MIYDIIYRNVKMTTHSHFILNCCFSYSTFNLFYFDGLFAFEVKMSYFTNTFYPSNIEETDYKKMKVLVNR